MTGSCTRSIFLRHSRLTHHMHKNIVSQRMERIAIARKGYFRPMLVPPLRIPLVPGRKASNCFKTGKRVVIRLGPGNEWLPDCFHLITLQPIAEHLHGKRVVGLNMNLLSPLVIEESVPIEADELADQVSVGV